MTGFAHMRFVSRLRECLRCDFHHRSPYALSRGRPEPRPAALLRRLIGDNVWLAVRECRPVAHRLRLSASP